MIADLKSCREKVVLRWKTVKDIRERWFGAELVASSDVSETAPRTIVRISDVVVVGYVQYSEEYHKLGLPCCTPSLSSPGKSERSRVSVSPVRAKKNKFLLKSFN